MLCTASHIPCLVYCSYVLLELVETERDYVRDLGLVVEVSDLGYSVTPDFNHLKLIITLFTAYHVILVPVFYFRDT